jgi:hypothetical protein
MGFNSVHCTTGYETGMGFDSVKLGMRDSWDLTMSNCGGYERGMGFNSVQLDMRETWDLTVYNWV